MQYSDYDLIIFSGKSRTGKDTCCNYLAKKIGWIVYAAATPVKEMASIAFNLPLKYFHDVDLKETPVNVFDMTDANEKLTPRSMMQIIYKDFFTEKLLVKSNNIYLYKNLIYNTYYIITE